MIAYLGASVLLRFVLRQPGALKAWRGILRAVASALVWVECLRTLDAIHLAIALLWRERPEANLIVATHDVPLGTAARSCGFRVVGAG